MLRKPNSIRRWLGLVAFLCCPGLPLASRAGDTDCNGNGIPDEQDLRTEVAFGQPYSVPTREVRASVLADVDADGDLDVLLQLFFQFDAVPQRWVLLRNDGTGHFAADENPPPLVGGEIVAADFNADGQMDLLLVGRLATDPEGPLHLRLYSTPVDWNSPQSDQVLSNPIGN